MVPPPELHTSRSRTHRPPQQPLRSGSLMDSWRRRLLGQPRTVPQHDVPADEPVDVLADQLPPAEQRDSREQRIHGVKTEDKVLRWFFQRRGLDVTPVVTAQFLEKSKDTYNEAWLARELIQNFVDANPDNPGTLDGVSITSEPLPGGGRRFTIRGNWPIEDITGMLTPHSDKPKDRETAGGNGIGLKQAAVRMLRDFGASRFQVHGQGWDVNYQLARADDVNAGMVEMLGPGECPAHRVDHDWLVADLHEAAADNKCHYIIEVHDPVVITALEQMSQLGVSRENEYLQDLDFENERGAIKWLPVPERAETASRSSLPQGRLFIDGQTMHFREKGPGVEDYWTGPELVSIRLNDAKYEMSIDRPPVKSLQLRDYVEKLIDSMTKDDLIDQLKRSQHIWTTVADTGGFSDKMGCFVIIERLVSKLMWSREYNDDEFAQHFPNDRLVAGDISNEAQWRELTEAGYILCPSYFSTIGMPKASSKLDQGERAASLRPDVSQIDYYQERAASRAGVIVEYDTVNFNSDEPAKFFQHFQTMLGDNMDHWEERPDKPGRVRIYLSRAVDERLLRHPLPNPRTQEHRLVRTVRGFAMAGLDNEVFQDDHVFSHQGEYMTTYATVEDPVTQERILLVRNSMVKGGAGSYIEFELSPEMLESFRAVFSEQEEKETTDEIATADGEQAAGTKEKSAQAKDGQDDEKPADEEDDVQEPAPGSREAVIKRIKAVPVEQPEPEPRRQHRRVEKVVEVEPAPEPEVPEEIGSQLPGIAEAVDKLDAAVPEGKEQPAVKQPEREEIPAHDPLRVYLRWRESGDFYGDIGKAARYLGGRDLGAIVNVYGEADIPIADVKRVAKPAVDTPDADAADRSMPKAATREVLKAKDRIDRINKRLERGIKSTKPREEWVDDFEIVINPDQEELVQLELLRSFVSIAADVTIPNDLFLYEGTGSKGINIGQRAIGLHAALTKARFFEAVRTMVHEAAHNLHMDHEVDFTHAEESIFAAIMDKRDAIIEKALAGQELNDEEKVLVDIRRQWETIRTQGF